MALIDIHTHSISSSHISILQHVDSDQILPNQYFSVGIHPAQSDTAKNLELSSIETLLNHKMCIAIGEIGLDNRLSIEMAAQESIYIQQLKLAEKHRLPILLHCVGSWHRCEALHAIHAPNQILIYHGFAKTTLLPAILKNKQTMISCGARLLNDLRLQEVVQNTPLDRLFLESDTEQIDLMELYQLMSRLKSIPLETLIDGIYSNFLRIFKV